MGDNHPSAFPHGPIEEIGPDLFMVRGSLQMNAVVRISRNMAIVRHGDELTLVDPIRLDAAGEQALRALGHVRHLLRLGPLHGRDDAYYTTTFGAALWTPGPSSAYPEPKPDHTLRAGGPLPFPDGEIFSFGGGRQAECALRLARGSGVLFTCDAIQHYGDWSWNNLPARLVMPLLGFRRDTLIGPIWLKLFTPKGHSLEGEFRRLLELDFDALLSAHGTFLASGAHASVERAIERAFPGGGTPPTGSRRG